MHRQNAAHCAPVEHISWLACSGQALSTVGYSDAGEHGAACAGKATYGPVSEEQRTLEGETSGLAYARRAQCRIHWQGKQLCSHELIQIRAAYEDMVALYKHSREVPNGCPK